jgi:hypothetical protein
MPSLRFISLALCVTTAASAGALPHATATALRNHAGFTEDQIASIVRGGRIVRSLPTSSPAQVAFAAGIRLPITLQTYLQRLRDGTLYRTGDNVLQIGRFGEHPGISDLNDFRVEGDEQRTKRSLLEAIARFEKNGTMGAGPLSEQPRTVDRKLEFEPVVQQAAFLRERLPAAYEYLLRYPHARSLGSDDFYLWTELAFGLRPVTRVAQASIWEDKSRNEAIVLTRQIYANRYFEVSFQIDYLVADPAHDAVYLMTLNYGRSQLLGSVAGRVVRPLVVSRTLAIAEKTLDQAVRDLRAMR